MHEAIPEDVKLVCRSVLTPVLQLLIPIKTGGSSCALAGSDLGSWSTASQQFNFDVACLMMLDTL